MLVGLFVRTSKKLLLIFVMYAGRIMCPYAFYFCIGKEKEDMNIEKGKIERGDEVYATLSLAGKTIVELKQVDDVTGVDDVMRKLRLLAGLYTGMARVYIRNRSKGWAMQLSMLMCKSVRSLRTRSQLVAEGVCDATGQYVIPFA